MLLRIKLFLALAGLTAAACAQPCPPPPAAIKRAERIEQLIRQLGDEQFALREAATKALLEIGNPARAALAQAVEHPDAEVALRARTILDKLPKLTHTLVDALGHPIPLAAVTLSAVGTPLPAVPGVEPPPMTDTPAPIPVVTDEEGRLGIPESEDGVRLHARVEHEQYGIARCQVEAGKPRLIVPLVRAGSEAHRRALTGRLTTPDGRPVAGAVIVCDNIRTPGEGLIEPLYPRGEVLSDDQGRFAIYPPPSEQRKSERGELIPPNSRYSLSITAADGDLLPLAWRAANTQPEHIVWPVPTRMHRFRFEAIGGGWIESDEQLRRVRVQLDAMQDGERMLTPLDTAALARGRKLLSGKYVAQCSFGGKTIEYLPVTIADGSPEQLDFRLVPAVTYRGQVVSGISGEPISDAIVFAYRSSSRNNLALLTADDWKLLAKSPSNPPLDHPAVKRLGEFYGVEGLVRADREGRFEITRQSDREFYGLIACAENQLPYMVRLYSLKAAGGPVDAGRFLLFPAAKVQVRPVFEGQSLAVSPFWLLEKDGQPDWFARFRTAFNGSDRCLEYVHWLALNESQPVFVPAGVRLRLRFETPYDDKWTPTTIAEVLQLEPAAMRDLGDVRFAASLPVSVRVVDSRGEGVEGFAVRRMYQGENAWCVAHNTDQDGLAHFHVHPKSQGQFRVMDLAGPKEIIEAKNLRTEFRVGDQPPATALEITVTDEQIKLLRGK